MLGLLPSLGLVFLSGLALAQLSEKLKLPALVGYLFSGMLLGQWGFALLGQDLLGISGELRQLALVIILLKAGFTLAVEPLKQVGKPAVFLSFVPACCEILACTAIAPLFFPLSYKESALLGTVLAAVSPAVIVPRMINFLEKGLGKIHQAPTLVLAAASLDDIFVIVLFSSVLKFVEEGDFSMDLLLQLPFSLVSGVILGYLLGKSTEKLRFFQNASSSQRLIFLLGLSFFLLYLEEIFTISALLAIMVLGLSTSFPTKQEKETLSQDLASLWKGAEILLFTLVGAEVNPRFALSAGLWGILLLCCGLLARSLGVYFSCSGFPQKIRQFVIISYLPKATVQAGIGGIPFALGLDCGELVLTLAVLSILTTAPLGAFLIDRVGESLLREGDTEERRAHDEIKRERF